MGSNRVFQASTTPPRTPCKCQHFYRVMPTDWLPKFHCSFSFFSDSLLVANFQEDELFSYITVQYNTMQQSYCFPVCKQINILATKCATTSSTSSDMHYTQANSFLCHKSITNSANNDEFTIFTNSNSPCSESYTDTISLDFGDLLQNHLNGNSQQNSKGRLCIIYQKLSE